MEWLENNLWICYFGPLIGIVGGSLVGWAIGETIRFLKG